MKVFSARLLTLLPTVTGALFDTNNLFGVCDEPFFVFLKYEFGCGECQSTFVSRFFIPIGVQVAVPECFLGPFTLSANGSANFIKFFLLRRMTVTSAFVEVLEDSSSVTVSTKLTVGVLGNPQSEVVGCDADWDNPTPTDCVCELCDGSTGTDFESIATEYTCTPDGPTDGCD